MAKRPARQRSQLPHTYYEGYLEKRSFKDKKSRKLWTCLCGNTLFFYNDKRDNDYVEKLELSGLIAVTDDGSVDCNLDAARLNLQMKNENIKFTAPNAEARELWKGFILSVAELSVPSCLNLLPGQIQMLKEAVEKEQERIKSAPPPAVSSPPPPAAPQADMPACFHSVSRLEAELLLERRAERGNLLLRPGSDGKFFAVTTRQDLNGSIFKHYRVTRKQEGGFIIAVDDPVPCATLRDVINYLVDKTNGVLVPLIMEEPYEKKITFIRSDDENGELESVQDAASNLVPPSVSPKPDAPRITTPGPTPAPITEENWYLNEMQPGKKVPKKAMMPPTPAPRRLAPATLPASATPPASATSPPPTTPPLSPTPSPPPPSVSPPPSTSPQPSAAPSPTAASPTRGREKITRANTDLLSQTMTELKLKLEKQYRATHQSVPAR